MVRQVWLEWRYSRKSKETYIALIVMYFLCFLFGSWFACYVVFMGDRLEFLKLLKNREMPEVMCFLPMERSARQRYIRIKSYLLAGVLGVNVILILFICCIPRGEQVWNFNLVFLVMVLGIDLFLYTAEQYVAKENTGNRQVGLSLYREICCPKWYRILFKTGWVIRIALIISGGAMEVTPINIILTSVVWTGITAASLMLLGIIHIFLIRHDLAVLDMGDYKRKADEEGVVRYEH